MQHWSAAEGIGGCAGASLFLDLPSVVSLAAHNRINAPAKFQLASWITRTMCCQTDSERIGNVVLQLIPNCTLEYFLFNCGTFPLQTLGFDGYIKANLSSSISY